MGWRLASGVGYCEVDGELVFLDLGRDKYLSLRGGDRTAFERLKSGEPNDSEAMTRLVGTRLLQRCEGGSRLDAASIRVPADDLSSRDAPFDLRTAFSSALALRWAASAMKPDRIARTMAGLVERKSGAVSDEIEIVDCAARYAACRWINPVAPRCLIDALALDRLLLKQGLSASLVFGVRLAPFAAHCWLQTPGYILTCTAADAHNFTPIMVVA